MDKMLATMTSPQLTELEAVWAIEGGWGDYKQDYRSAQIAQILANVNRNTKSKPTPYGIDDFALRPQEPRQVDQKATEKKIRFSLDGLAGVKAGKKKKCNVRG